MIKLVAWDWNGTLLADTQTIVDATNVELKTIFKKTTTLKEYRENFVIPVSEFFKNIGVDVLKLEKNYKKSAQTFDVEYEKRVKKCRTRSGTRKLLVLLAKNKIKSVIFSNHTKEKIGQQVKRLKLTEFFDAILANDHIHEAYTIKGKEKRLLEYMRKKKIKPAEILIIGDTAEEIVIGHDMGAKTIAITAGHSDTKRLKAVKPDYLVSNLLEIKKIIQELRPALPSQY
jgi:phosphoglycolate phosphatase-like HAD superfamily hydrolase